MTALPPPFPLAWPDSQNHPLRVLIGCATSCVTLDAFLARGHDAWQCDLLPADQPTNRHIQGDVRDHLADGWDLLMICNPPCTSAKLSVRRAASRKGRWLAGASV